MCSHKPCEECPWIKKGQPLITEELRIANDNGQWFCCHTQLGTCTGAEKMRGKISSSS